MTEYVPGPGSYPQQTDFPPNVYTLEAQQKRSTSPGQRSGSNLHPSTAAESLRNAYLQHGGLAHQMIKLNSTSQTFN